MWGQRCPTYWCLAGYRQSCVLHQAGCPSVRQDQALRSCPGCLYCCCAEPAVTNSKSQGSVETASVQQYATVQAQQYAQQYANLLVRQNATVHAQQYAALLKDNQCGEMLTCKRSLQVLRSDMLTGCYERRLCWQLLCAKLTAFQQPGYKSREVFTAIRSSSYRFYRCSSI